MAWITPYQRRKKEGQDDGPDYSYYVYWNPNGVRVKADREIFTDLFDSPTGRYAQLVAAAIIIRNLTHLPDDAGLAAILHRHTDQLLDETI